MSSINNSKPFSKLPGVLAFKRLTVMTDALMYSEVDGQLIPVPVIRHGIRGTQNVTGKSPRQVSNVQVTDTAKLAQDSQALVVKFQLRFLPLSDAIHSVACQEVAQTEEYRKSFNLFIERAATSEGVQEVANRFARNVLNGRWIWRNRTLSQALTVTVKCGDVGLDVQEDSLRLPLNSFGDYSQAEIELGQSIAQSLLGRSNAVFDIEARAQFGLRGMVEVYPSENFVSSKEKPTGLARLLYCVGHADSGNYGKEAFEFQATRKMGHAALRDQKVGNALRTIDTWYPEAAEHGLPIAVEPKGANLDAQRFFRDGKDASSSFDLARSFHLIDPDSDDGKFLIAALIRGGVYSEGDKPGKKANTAETSANSDEA